MGCMYVHPILVNAVSQKHLEGLKKKKKKSTPVNLDSVVNRLDFDGPIVKVTVTLLPSRSHERAIS